MRAYLREGGGVVIVMIRNVMVIESKGGRCGCEGGRSEGLSRLGRITITITYLLGFLPSYVFFHVQSLTRGISLSYESPPAPLGANGLASCEARNELL